MTPPPKHVLMTADAVGGVWTYALDLAGALAADGVRTTLAVMGPSPSADQIEDAGRIAGLDLVDTGLPLDWTASQPEELVHSARRLQGLATELKPDVVHLNSPALAADAQFEAPALGVCHSCVATWWSAVREGRLPADFGWRTRAFWRGLLACDGLLAPSRAFAEDIARTHDVPPPFVVYNGRRERPLRPLLETRPFVLTAGRLWDEGKNAAVLDKAASLIDRKIYAAGPLTNPADGSRISLPNLRLLGRLSAPELEVWMDEAPVYASSALYEPFGLGVLEAAQAGCALVLSDIPTFRELWDGAAILLDPRRPQLFAEAFERLLTDPAQARRLGAAAQARSNLFSIERMGRGILDVYERLCAAPRTQTLRGAAA